MLCPNCQKEMMKAGPSWSGNREVQSYRCGNRKCPKYGHRIMNSKEDYHREVK